MQKFIVYCNNLSFSCGYHRAYTELFNLVENRRKARVEQGPGGPLSQGIGQTRQLSNLQKARVFDLF